MSHRLPIEVHETEGGTQTRASPGGLARALNGVLRSREGTWVGTPGAAGPVQVDPDTLASFPYTLVTVPLSEQEMERYYQGFSNQIMWPLFHDLHPYCEFKPSYWHTYVRVNRRFANSVAETPGDHIVWIHDYHLLLVPEMLREAGDRRRMGFFLHVPFPPAELLERLPWHRRILESLTQPDLVGFQTVRDLENFLTAVRTMLPDAHVERDAAGATIQVGHRHARAGAFPISIDAESLHEQATSAEVERIHRDAVTAIGEEQTCIVGVERLDYTKGVPERLNAFKRALERYPQLRGRVTLLQHLDPSREDIPRYTNLREEVERLVGHINGIFGTMGWVPVRYSYAHLDFKQILSLYRLGDVALITPLRDGMNLVAKEYCIANPEGVLILSRFAGAADEFAENALVVNPHDIDQVAQAIHSACTLPIEERRARVQAMAAHVRGHDVHDWANGFLTALDVGRIGAGPSGPTPYGVPYAAGGGATALHTAIPPGLEERLYGWRGHGET